MLLHRTSYLYIQSRFTSWAPINSGVVTGRYILLHSFAGELGHIIPWILITPQNPPNSAPSYLAHSYATT